MRARFQPASTSTRRAALVLSTFFAACDPSGDDVFLGPARQPAVACDLTPGEDACTRFAAQSSDARSVIANATSFAGDARDLVRRLDAACLDVVLALGAQRQPARGMDPRDRMEAVCRDAFTALSARKPAGATTASAPARCSAAPVPACILDAIAVGWQSCAPPEVTVQGASTAEAQPWAAAVERTLPPIVSAWAESSILRDRGERVRIAAGGEGTNDHVCVAESAHIVAEALLDLASVFRVSAHGSAAVGLTTHE